MIHEKKIDKSNFKCLKRFLETTLLKKGKSSHSMGENIGKAQIRSTCIHSMQRILKLNCKKTNNWKNETNVWKNTSPKKMCRWEISIWEVSWLYLFFREFSIKITMGCHCKPITMTKVEKLAVLNADKDVEQ